MSCIRRLPLVCALAGLLCSAPLLVFAQTPSVLNGSGTEGRRVYSAVHQLSAMLACCACRAIAFALGLATTLALLGVFSSALGKSYGQIGEVLPIGTVFFQMLCLNRPPALPGAAAKFKMYNLYPKTTFE